LLLAEAGGDFVLAGRWQSLAGIFTTLPSSRCPEQVWMIRQDAQVPSALLPGWLACRCSQTWQAVLLLPYQLQSLHAVITEMGRTETLAEETDFHPRQTARRCMCALPLSSITLAHVLTGLQS